MSTGETDGLRTVAEVASDLRCSRLTVYRAIERGELEAVRIGENGGLRIHDSSVSTFLVPAGDQRRVPAREVRRAVSELAERAADTEAAAR